MNTPPETLMVSGGAFSKTADPAAKCRSCRRGMERPWGLRFCKEEQRLGQSDDLFLVCVEKQRAEEGHCIGTVVVPYICLFGELIDHKAVAFQRMVQQVGKAAGRIGIGTLGTAAAAFVGQQHK